MTKVLYTFSESSHRFQPILDAYSLISEIILLLSKMYPEYGLNKAKGPVWLLVGASGRSRESANERQ